LRIFSSRPPELLFPFPSPILLSLYLIVSISEGAYRIFLLGPRFSYDALPLAILFSLFDFLCFTYCLSPYSSPYDFLFYFFSVIRASLERSNGSFYLGFSLECPRRPPRGSEVLWHYPNPYFVRLQDDTEDVPSSL